MYRTECIHIVFHCDDDTKVFKKKFQHKYILFIFWNENHFIFLYK